MAYRVPDGYVNVTDVPDPDLLNRTTKAAVEELGARLNDHNFTESGLNANRRATEAFYDFHTARVSADTGINTNVDDIPDNTSPNAWAIPDSSDWTTVDQMQVSFTSGEDTAWIIGWAQYGLAPQGAIVTFSTTAVSLTKPRVQFALRVNGAVLPHGITGLVDVEAHPRSLMPVMPFDPATPPDNVSVDSLRLRGTSSMGWHVHAKRVQAFQEIPQGTTTIDLVVRRIPPDDALSQTGEIEPVYVYSRMLVAVQMKRTSPTLAPSATAVNVEYATETDPVSAAVINSNLLQPMRTAINDLSAGSVMYSGLRREHLPGGQSGLRSADQTAVTNGNTTTRLYPGYGSNGTVNAANWAEVAGTTTTLRVTGPFNYTTAPAFTLVLANVAHKKAIDTGVAATAEQYSVYAIGGQYSSGTNFHSSDAECFINNPNVTPNWGAGYPTLFDNDTDVQLMEFFDYRTAPPAGGTVSFYRVLAAFCGSAGAPSVEWQAGSIQVLHFFP